MTTKLEEIARAILFRRTQEDFSTINGGQWVLDHDMALARAALEAILSFVPDKVYLPHQDDMSRWRAIGWNECRAMIQSALDEK